LVASEAETFGLIAAESQACGTPVICTDVGGLPEVVASGIGGIVVPVRSVEGFVEGIRQLCNDRGLWQRMSAAGVEWVLERFSDDVMVDSFLELYRRL
jgi:D-inositol-3-phosphate glycosyltransferase